MSEPLFTTKPAQSQLSRVRAELAAIRAEIAAEKEMQRAIDAHIAEGITVPAEFVNAMMEAWGQGALLSDLE